MLMIGMGSNLTCSNRRASREQSLTESTWGKQRCRQQGADHFFLDVVVCAQFGLGSQVHQRCIVVRRVRRHGRDHACRLPSTARSQSQKSGSLVSNQGGELRDCTTMQKPANGTEPCPS